MGNMEGNGEEGGCGAYWGYGGHEICQEEVNAPMFLSMWASPPSRPPVLPTSTRRCPSHSLQSTHYHGLTGPLTPNPEWSGVRTGFSGRTGGAHNRSLPLRKCTTGAQVSRQVLAH
jgi:hypothetical protein